MQARRPRRRGTSTLRSTSPVTVLGGAAGAALARPAALGSRVGAPLRRLALWLDVDITPEPRSAPGGRAPRSNGCPRQLRRLEASIARLVQTRRPAPSCG
eukprot:14020395-Alexandrium_andersonii.AAC.1